MVHELYMNKAEKKKLMGDFLGSPVAMTLQSQCSEPGFDPWLGN